MAKVTDSRTDEELFALLNPESAEAEQKKLKRG